MWVISEGKEVSDLILLSKAQLLLKCPAAFCSSQASEESS